MRFIDFPQKICSDGSATSLLINCAYSDPDLNPEPLILEVQIRIQSKMYRISQHGSWIRIHIQIMYFLRKRYCFP
jgi:hypothetical protein